MTYLYWTVREGFLQPSAASITNTVHDGQVVMDIMILSPRWSVKTWQSNTNRRSCTVATGRVPQSPPCGLVISCNGRLPRSHLGIWGPHGRVGTSPHTGPHDVHGLSKAAQPGARSAQNCPARQASMGCLLRGKHQFIPARGTVDSLDQRAG